MKKERIWELDALRGFCILCMVAVHLIYDLITFAGMQLALPGWFLIVQNFGGIIFVILSGICVTLGSRHIKRGLIVFAAGMLITAVTALMSKLGLSDESVIVRFGVLHLLGISMLLYGLYRKQPTAAILAQAICFIVLGYLFIGVRVQTHLLFPFGLCYPGFFSSDYFPLFPQFGYFLLGVCLGRTLYREKKPLLSVRLGRTAPMRFFCFCGRQSLWIYLAHQPILFALTQLLS